MGPELECVMETSLYVSDLQRAAAFYGQKLGLRMIGEFDRQRGIAFRVGPSVLLLFRAEVTRAPGEVPSHGCTGQGHAAFRVAPEQIPVWRERLRERGVEIEREVVFGDGNPPSLYFRDPDGNSLEIAVAAIWPD
jgi:catechol 2,3-dioxygenase-like lactoylglutathione lyase family enzyme